MPELNDDIFDVSALVEKLLYPFRLLIKNYKASFIAVASSAALSLLLYFTLPATYSASFIVKVNEKNDSYYANMLLDLIQLTKDGDYSGLAKELKMPESEVSLLRKISIDVIYKSRGTDSAEAVIIGLYTKTYGNFESLQSGILKYLDDNVHYSNIRKKRLINLENLKAKLNRDMQEIDSVKKIVIHNITPKSGISASIVYNVPLDPFRAYEVNMQRYREQMNLILQKELPNSFELIKPCVASKKPVSPKLRWIFLILMPITLIACIFYLHFKSSRSENNL